MSLKKVLLRQLLLNLLPLKKLLSNLSRCKERRAAGLCKMCASLQSAKQAEIRRLRAQHISVDFVRVLTTKAYIVCLPECN